MMKKLWIIVIILCVGFGSLDAIGSNHISESVSGNKNKEKDKIPTEKYLIILNDGHKVKEIVGLDVSNNGSGIIKKSMIKRMFGTKHNFKRRKKKLEKRLAKTTDKKRKARIQKRLKRIEQRIKKHKQMKKEGKFKYKEKVFVLTINKTIPSDTVLLKLKRHPAIKAVSKDQVVKVSGMPNDKYVNNGRGGWPMEQTSYINNISPVKIRTNNLNENQFDWYGSKVERLWYLKTIEIDRVWDLDQTIDGEGVIVAVIDSGLRTSHEDITGNIWTNSDEMGNGKEKNGIDDDPFTPIIPSNYINWLKTDYIDDWQGWNYKDNSNSIIDDNGHGTHVIGTIAAVGNNTKGIIGIAPKAKIMVLRTLGGPSGTGSVLDTISAIDYAINQGADVINMSLGSGVRLTVDMSSAVNMIYDTLFTEANNLNVILCIAAGNSRAKHSETNYAIPGEIFSSDLREAYSPAWFSTRHNNIMTVSATTWGESNSSKAYKVGSTGWQKNNTFNEHLSNFSNFSSRIANAITVAAPGIQIYSMSHSSDTRYIRKQGTSMATPVVAGLAALIVGINSNLSATEVIDLIKNNTDQPVGTDLANVDYAGAGRINAYKTVMAALNSLITITSPQSNTTITKPNLTISGTTKENIANLQIYQNKTAVGSTFSSDSSGNFSGTVTHDNDSTVPVSFTVSGVINGNRVTADAVNLKFDIYKPQISSPSHQATITGPSFKIVGTTQPHTLVELLKRTAGSQDPYILVNSGQTDAGGKFDITIQPSESEFQNSYEFIASSSVNVAGIQTQKTSEANTYTYTRLINMVSPINNTKIYIPELRLIGTTASPNVTLQTFYSSNNTSTGNTFTSDGSNTFDQVIPFNKDGTYPFKVSGEINGLRTTSNVATVTFDIYKPIVTLPASGIISVPTFNMIGTTSPNATVEILKRTIGGTYGFVASKNADANGEFNILIQPQPEEYSQTLELIASASVNIESNITQKQSSISTFNYQIPDYPPIINTPITNTTIVTPTFSIIGTSTKNTLINILENGTISQNTTSDTNGNYTIELTTPFSENEISRQYKASANIYEIPRESNEITLHFDLYKPQIKRPATNSTITTPTFNIIGQTKPNNTVNIFRREQGQSVFEFIASKNSDVQGTFNITIKPTHVDYQKTFEFIASASITESGVTYNKISTVNTYSMNIWEPFIQSPRNFEEISTHTLPVSGTGTQNSVVKIYHHTEANPTLQLLGSTNTNATGNWAGAFKAPQNNDYFITAIIEKEDYRGTSNSVAFNMNYNFDEKELRIDSPITETSTHKKTISVSGLSPNGTLHFYIDDQLSQIIPVNDNHWRTTADLPSEKTFKFQARISHNALEKVSNTVNVLRNSTPKITETSQQVIADNTFVLSGIGKEKTVLTITQTENSLSLLSNSIHTLSNTQPEHIIGQVTTDENGEWLLSININSPGEYSFKVYENYGSNQQLTSENYTYDILLDNNNIQLNVAPNPYNPSQSTLKIEYNFPTESNVDISIYSISGFKVFGTNIPKNTMGAISNQRNIYVWDGTSNGKHVPPGLYIVIVKISGETTTIKTKRVGIKW